MPDAPKESLPQNPLQKEVILDLYVCVEECRHYIRSNLQLLHILYSLFLRPVLHSDVNCDGSAVHMTIDHTNGWRT